MSELFRFTSLPLELRCMAYKWAVKDTCRFDRNMLREYIDEFCDQDLPAFLNTSKLVRAEAFQTVVQHNEVDISIMPQDRDDGLVGTTQAYIGFFSF
jgi:hypothetical protein